MLQISIAKRHKIIVLYMKRKSHRFIAKKLKLCRTTVTSIINRFEKDPTSLDNKPKSGRPKKMWPQNIKKLVDTSKKNPFFNATDLKNSLQNEVTVSSSLIRKCLLKNRLPARIAAWKPLLSAINVQKRFQWSQSLIEKDINYWKKFFF